VRQFSKGPRMCIGKRFAELELQLLFCELLRSYKIEWAGDPEGIEPKLKFTYVPNKPLRFKFTPL